MRKSGLTGDEAYVLSKHGKTTEDLSPLKKEIGKLKEDLEALGSGYNEYRFTDTSEANTLVTIPFEKKFKKGE